MWPAGEEVIEPGEEVEAGTKKTKAMAQENVKEQAVRHLIISKQCLQHNWP
jgi:hypothetical protein